MKSEVGKFEEQLALLASIIDSSDDAIISKTLDGVITSWNRGAQNIFGYSMEEAIGKNNSLIVPPGMIKEEAEIIEKIKKGEPVNHQETQRLKKNGDLVDISLTISPIRNSKGIIIGASKIARDISGSKKAKAEISKLNLELEERVALRTNQLQTINREMEAFTYSVSRDLRAPLRIINGFSQILIEDYSSQLDEAGQKTLLKIMKNAKRMGRLIDDLLAFSQLGRSEIRTSEVDMNQLVSEVLEEIAISGISIPVQLRLSDLHSAHGDVNLLKQVWTNLLTNAIKYSSKKKHPTIEIGMKNDGDKNIYFIKDNGAGFDMHYYSKLFGVFQRLHKESEFEGSIYFTCKDLRTTKDSSGS